MSNYVQKTDYATANNAGVVKIMSNSGGGIDIVNQYLRIAGATDAYVKSGSSAYRPLTPSIQHTSTFYGLAKAAGDTTQSQSANAVGTYTDEAKTAIQQMLDVPSTGDIPDTSNYATKADTVLDTTLSRGRREESTVGEGSFAFGSNVEASGANSFAIGYYSLAKGDASYARGTYAKALGNSSSAEGSYIHAVGTSSHAEGGASTKVIKFTGEANSTIYKISSFIPVGSLIGNPSAPNGVFSAVIKVEQIDDLWYATLDSTLDSENSITDLRRQAYIGSALESYSHTEGSNSIASGMMQHVEGRNNYVDANYAHIVGNGFTSTQRSNAYALDWDGNGHYMGDVYVHANADSTGGTKLATIEDIPDVPVQDVQVNGVSVLTDGVANVPVASTSQYGAMMVGPGLSTMINGGNTVVCASFATGSDIKKGKSTTGLIRASHQHESTFYGLAKAAGADEKDSTLPVGEYTDTAKSAIRTMLGAASDNIIAISDTAPTDPDTKIWIPETATSVQVPTVSEMETALAGKVGDVQVAGTSVVGSDGVAAIPLATSSQIGVVSVGDYGISVSGANNTLVLSAGAPTETKTGTNIYRPVVVGRQHQSVFYGLSKAAGVDLANETVTLGQYPEASKIAIKAMLGVEEGLKVVRLI